MKTQLLTPRDRILLESLSDFGLMSTSQLERKIFSGIRSTTVLRRLRKLEKRKLITRSSGLPKGKLAWSITAKGGSLIALPDGYGHINRNTLEHDIWVSELRLILEQIGACRGWKSGHSLKREVSPKKNESVLLPDGILLLPVGNTVKTVAIELELSAKAQGRYAHVFREYSGKKSIDCVWYIVSHPGIAKVLMRALHSGDSSGRKANWVYWTPLSEFLGDPLQIQLRSKSKTLWLKDLTTLTIPVHQLRQPAQSAAHEASINKFTEKIRHSSNPLNEQESSHPR